MGLEFNYLQLLRSPFAICLALHTNFSKMNWSYFLAGQQRGTVRLVRNGLTSTSYSSGRVQIYMSSWGYICDDVQFASTEADVLCHQLRYSGAFSHSKSSLDLWVFKYVQQSTHKLTLVMCWGVQLWDTVCHTGMEFPVATVFSWVMLGVLLVIIWWYYSAATPPTLEHVNKTEMKFLWPAVSHSVINIICHFKKK